MRQVRNTILAMLGTAVVVSACTSPGDSVVPEALTLLAHDSFAEAVTADTFAAFTAETGIEVEVIAGGDAGSMVNQAILTKDNPLADVLFGVDDTFLSRALDEGLFVVHEAAGIDRVADDLVEPGNLVTPIDFGDVCINYDKAWFETTQIQVPTDLDDLRADLYASHLTVEHPATSSPGLAFMLTTIDVFGEEGWLDYWADLRDAGVKVATDWNTAYFGDFLIYGGDSSMVVSYASSPPAEVIFAEETLETAPTGVIQAGCYRQVEYAGVLAGTPYPVSAGKLIDFMLTVEFQETVPLNWFVFPVNRDAALPEEFVKHTVIPASPARFDAETIARNRDRWINQWIEVMER